MVKPGETIYRIAKRYGISPRTLMGVNHITDARELRVGQKLIIPTAAATHLASTGNWWNFRHGKRGRPPDDGRRFSWPIQNGTVTSEFGIRDGAMHEGIDIAAPAGSPVHAADAGRVIFAGRLHGYGKVIIVQHDEHYVTVYGHNETLDVSEAQRVVRGQIIGLVGTTGRTTGPNLHFEVRRNNTAYDPLYYLPAPSSANGIRFARDGGS